MMDGLGFCSYNMAYIPNLVAALLACISGVCLLACFFTWWGTYHCIAGLVLDALGDGKAKQVKGKKADEVEIIRFFNVTSINYISREIYLNM